MKRKKESIKIDRGELSYWMRFLKRSTWATIAEAIGFASHRGALSAAKKYAMKNDLPWPMKAMSKGDAAYRARRIGMSWIQIARRFNIKAPLIRTIAYKHADYYNKPWPPEKDNEQRKGITKVQHNSEHR